jgi:hypothetical protein
MSVRIAATLLAALCLASCRTAVEHAKVRELAAVAKDWCLTIRASQVLPVYPLTEDLQVGDMFLVSSPLEEEVHDLEKDGFLPLDNVIARLQPVGWQQFYNGAYQVTADSVLPKQWQFPQPPPTQAPYTAWATAPGAAFPSYTFQVKKGAGAMLAIPIQAVPVGLSLLGASDASGTVNISSASTYGLPVTVLSPQVDEWARANRDFLKQYPPRVEKDQLEQHYVRIVYRVYVAGGVTVSLINNDSAGARADAGASKPVALFDAGGATESVNAAGNYTSVLSSLSQSVASKTPGASLTLSSASSNSVAMNETFPRPLVIGYLAFDRAINEGGILGPPIPTHARVTNKRLAEGTAVYGSDANADRIRAWLSVNAANRKTLQDWLAPRVPDVTVPLFLNGEQYAQLRASAVSALGIQ